MEKIRVLIVEDQLLIAKDLARKLEDHGVEVIDICPSGEEAITTAENQSPDLILMDIELDGALDGISTASIIKEKFQIPIIYLSDFGDKRFVDRAKKTMPLNYLTKPFKEEDLIRAIEIASYSIKVDNSKVNTNKYLFLKDQYKLVKIAYDNILFLEAHRAYSNLVTKEKVYTFSNNMKSVHEQLQRPEFIRVHKSYVVNLHAIDSIEGNMLKLGNHEIQMSKEHKNDVINRIKIIK